MAAPATLTVFDNVYDDKGVAIANTTVTCVLDSTVETTSGGLIAASQQSTTTDNNGRFQFTVIANDLLSPANSTYTISIPAISRSYQIAPQSGNGSSQQTTAANVIVNTPNAIAPWTNLTGNLTVAGTLGVTGLTSDNGGLVVAGGTGATLNASGDLAVRSVTVSSGSGPYTPTAAAGNIAMGNGAIAGGTIALGGPPGAGTTTVFFAGPGSGFIGKLMDLQDPTAVSRFQIDQSGLASVTTIQFDPPGTAHQIQLFSTTGVNGRRLAIQSGDTPGPAATGSAEIMLVPANTAPNGNLNSEIIWMNVQGANYERFVIAATQNTYVIDSTVQGTGVGRPIIFEMQPASTTTEQIALYIQNDSSVLLNGASFSVSGSNFGANRTTIADWANTGDSRLVIDTRTTTPASNVADDSMITFRRGGASKWNIGLNVRGDNADFFDIQAAVTGSGKVQISGDSIGHNQHLRILDTGASGHAWEIGEPVVAGSLSFKDMTVTGTSEVLRLVGINSGVNLLSINSAIATTAPSFAAIGSDTNIDIRETPKGSGVMDWNYATVALGGGSAPTFGTIGGSGPATAAQNAWFKCKIAGTVSFFPMWR